MNFTYLCGAGLLFSRDAYQGATRGKQDDCGQPRCQSGPPCGIGSATCTASFRHDPAHCPLSHPSRPDGRARAAFRRTRPVPRVRTSCMSARHRIISVTGSSGASPRRMAPRPAPSHPGPIFRPATCCSMRGCRLPKKTTNLEGLHVCQ